MIETRDCRHCFRSFGEQEHGAWVDGTEVHKRCEDDYRRSVAEKSARARRRMLHLPSIRMRYGADGHDEDSCL